MSIDMNRNIRAPSELHQSPIRAASEPLQGPISALEQDIF